MVDLNKIVPEQIKNDLPQFRGEIILRCMLE